jgi:hypothetical protein
MEKPRTLLTFHDLNVEVETTAAEELVEHILSTTLGTPGGFRYQHMDLEERLRAPGENYFMYLRKNGRMLGSVGYVGRHTRTLGTNHDSWMIRYFSIKAPLRTTPKKRKEKEDVKETAKRSSVLGRFIRPVFDNPSSLRVRNEEQGPAIIYALIEEKNLRSMNFSSQMGLETIGSVSSFTFNRFRPKKSSRVEVLPNEEQQEMRELLANYYKDHTLYFDDPLFKDDRYYVIRDGGKIVAGVQYYPVRWHVVDFGQGIANFAVGLLAKIPWIRRRVNPDELRIVAFDGMYCENGYEDLFYELLEGVLALSGRYLGMVMLDKQSELFRVFMEKKKLGILYSLLGSFNADVRMRFINIPEETRQGFLDRPTYIPTYDNS